MRDLRIRSRFIAITAAVTAWSIVSATPALAHGDAPAGGAPLEDLVPAAIVAAVLAATVGVFGWAHRTGRTSALDRLSGFSERVSGLAGFAAPGRHRRRLADRGRLRLLLGRVDPHRQRS